MGKKLLLIVAAIALLIIGAIAGLKYAGDNRNTVVGDTSRYSAAMHEGGALTRSVGRPEKSRISDRERTGRPHSHVRRMVCTLTPAYPKALQRQAPR